MAVATVNADVADMMLVAEGNGLRNGHFHKRGIGRPINRVQQPATEAQKSRRPKDAGARNRICASVKNLRHRAFPAAILENRKEQLKCYGSVFCRIMVSPLLQSSDESL
jgi:hypothetical protein